MRRILGLVAIAFALLIAVSSSQAEVPDCVEGSPPPQSAGGTVDVNPPAPVVHDDLMITARFDDSRPYVEGSMRTTVKRPDGTTVTFKSEEERFTPSEVGDYEATVTATYVACSHDFEPRY